MESLTPQELEAQRGCYLIDIRPLDERRAELGFIPGSLALGSAQELAELVDLDGLPVVVYCTSGRRSAQFIEELEGAMAARVKNLDGGVLAWGAAGLPLVTEDVTSHGPDASAQAFVLGLRSCFIGQLVETILEFDLDLDPLELFEQLESRVREKPHPSSAELLRELVDHAAHLSRLLGTPLDAIARNTWWAYENVERFEDALPGDPAELRLAT
jgi:rhodanese-related sulfurtransferase